MTNDYDGRFVRRAPNYILDVPRLKMNIDSRQENAGGVKVTPQMIEAGLEAYELYADSPPDLLVEAVLKRALAQSLPTSLSSPAPADSWKPPSQVCDMVEPPRDDEEGKSGDEVLRRLLKTPPDPKTGKGEKPSKRQKDDDAKDQSRGQ